MIIACPACSTRYAVPDSAIGLEGRTVRCAKCRHSWFQEGPSLEPAQAAAQARATSTPQPITEPAAEPGFAPIPPETAPEPAAAASPPPAFRREPAPAPAMPRFEASSPREPVFSDYEASANRDTNRSEGPSRFEHAPPFRPRRNWTRIATIASVLFALVTLGLAGAVAQFGLPDWAPLPRPTFAQEQTDLQLNFPERRQDRRPLPDGSQYFSVSGTISNVGRESRYVPSILVVLRDQRERIVYEKEIVPAKRKLAPGEVLTVNEALTDIPKAASAAEIGWMPG